MTDWTTFIVMFCEEINTHFYIGNVSHHLSNHITHQLRWKINGKECFHSGACVIQFGTFSTVHDTNMNWYWIQVSQHFTCAFLCEFSALSFCVFVMKCIVSSYTACYRILYKRLKFKVKSFNVIGTGFYGEYCWFSQELIVSWFSSFTITNYSIFLSLDLQGDIKWVVLSWLATACLILEIYI